MLDGSMREKVASDPTIPPLWYALDVLVKVGTPPLAVDGVLLLLLPPPGSKPFTKSPNPDVAELSELATGASAALSWILTSS